MAHAEFENTSEPMGKEAFTTMLARISSLYIESIDKNSRNSNDDMIVITDEMKFEVELDCKKVMFN